MLNPLLCVNWGLMEEVKTCFPQSTRQSRVFFCFFASKGFLILPYNTAGSKRIHILSYKNKKSSLHTTISKISGQKSWKSKLNSKSIHTWMLRVPLYPFFHLYIVCSVYIWVLLDLFCWSQKSDKILSFCHRLRLWL